MHVTNAQKPVNQTKNHKLFNMKNMSSPKITTEIPNWTNDCIKIKKI